MSTLKKKEPLKVFRITLLGRAEAGKTTVCTQFIANGYSTRYEHTESPHMYYREMKPKDLSMNNESKYTSSSNTTNTGNSKHKHHHTSKKSKKKKKAVFRYGVQLEDIPGEINEEVTDDSIENEIIERTQPQDYYDTMVPAEEYIDEYGSVAIDEKSTLLPRRQQRNRLYGPTLSHGFIIVYDVGSKPSFAKALALHKTIRSKHDKHKTPIYFLGNKLDASKPSAMEQIEKITVYSRGNINTEAATGSLSRNEIYFEDKIMTSADFVNSVVQTLNKNGLFMTESDNDRKEKRNKKKQGDGTIDDENRSVGCFGCCASNTNKEKYDDEGALVE